MAPKYTHAIVQRISASFQNIGDIDLEIAKKQHEAYVNILREIGLDVIELPPDDGLPQGIFVENSAVICNGVALIAKSNSIPRQKENDALKIVLKKELDIPTVDIEEESAYLDGCDILFTGREFFVGLTDKTNEGGAVALAEAFPEYPCVPIKVNGDKCLKYYISMAGPNLLAVSDSEISQDILKRIERVASFSYQTLTLDEEFAANMLYINGYLIHRSPLEIPESHRTIKSKIDTPTRNVDISEISRFSSGLTSCCLLLRRWKSVRNI
ncbi:DDAH2 family protein [Megaselia abdita]